MPLLDGALFRLPEDIRHPNLTEHYIVPTRTRSQLFSGVLDGSFAVTVSPVANNWEVSCILLQMRTFATAGARSIIAQITPTADSPYLKIPLLIGISTADANVRIVAIGGPGYNASLFGSGGPFEAITFPTPNPLYMTTGYLVEVFDANGVDATDSVDMTIIYREVTEWNR